MSMAQTVIHVSAAANAGEVAGRQATGVFAGEPGRSGWTQLLDSVDVHPPLAHQGLSRPTSQNQLLLHRPPVELHHAPDHQQQHQQQQQQLPSMLRDQAAEPQPEPQGMDFQYDSFSDSLDDHQVPSPQRTDAEHRTEEEAALQAAEQQNQSPGAAAGSSDPVLKADQQKHTGSTAGVIPQVDGAADSDSVDSEAPNPSRASHPPAPQPGHGDGTQLAQASTYRHPPPSKTTAAFRAPGAHSALPGSSPDEAGMVTIPGLHATIQTHTAAVGSPHPRRRRSRQVVQHAVLLAAAAHTAMVAAGSPEEEDSRHPPSAPGLQSEPQLPSKRLPPVPPYSYRQFQSEPQSLERRAEEAAHIHDSAMQRRAAELEMPQPVSRTSSQLGIVGKQQVSALHHQPSQQTVASPACIASQVVSDSRATSDLRWQTRQHQGQAMPSQLLPTRMLASQVVSDSRATSDHRWALGLQRQPATSQQPPEVPMQPGGQDSLPDGRGCVELAWEEEADQPGTMTQDGKAAEAAEASDVPDDLEVVISDSQPSPPLGAGPLTQSPHSLEAAQQQPATHQSPHASGVPNQNGLSPTHTHSAIHDPATAEPPVPHTQDQLSASQIAEAGGTSPKMLEPHQQHDLQQIVGMTVADTPMPDQSCHASHRQEPYHMPTFSTTLNAAGSPSAGEALTPVMVPHAQARIQAQHGATPPVSVVKDTPQSAAAATPLSHVRDTPRQQTPLMQSVLPHRPSLLSHNAAAAYSTPMPLAGMQSARAVVPSAQQGRPGHFEQVADRQSRLSQPQAAQTQLQEALPVPELTLRLSFSDDSSTRSAKAGQTSPSTEPRPPHTQTSSQLGRVTALLQVPSSQPVPAHEASHVGSQISPHSAAMLSARMASHPPGSGSPPSAEKGLSSATGLGSSTPQLQATAANREPVVELATGADTADRPAAKPPSQDHAGDDVIPPDHFSEAGTVSAAGGSLAAEDTAAQGASHSSGDLHAGLDQADEPVGNGNLNAQNHGPDHDDNHDHSGHSRDPVADDPDCADDSPVAHEPDVSSDDSPDQGGDDRNDEDDDSRDHDEGPGDPDPGGDSTAYSLAGDLVPHRYKLRAPSQVRLS